MQDGFKATAKKNQRTEPPKQNKMKDIFVSYSRKDSTIAKKFRDLLTEEGWSVFWDVEILPGQAWSDQLEAKLNDCKCIVVLWSEHSLQSDYVKEEAAIGKSGKKLVPIMIGAGISPPFGFGMLEAAMLSDWDGNKENREYRNLIKAITEHVSPNKKTGTAAATQQPAHSTTTKTASIPISKTKTTTTSSPPVNTTKSKTPLFAGLGLALLAVLVAGYFFLNKSNNDSHTHTNNGKSEGPGIEEVGRTGGTNPPGGIDVKPVDNSAAISRLKNSISDINMNSKKTIDTQLQDVGNNKKEIIAPGKFTALKKTRTDLDTRMKQWVANGSSDLEQLKEIEADSKKYLTALNGSLGDVFKVVESVNPKAKSLITQLFGTNESKRKAARNDLMKTYGKDPAVMGALIKQCNIEFDKDLENNGIFQTIWALNEISRKSPESLRPHKKALFEFFDKSMKSYKVGTQGQMRNIRRNLN